MDRVGGVISRPILGDEQRTLAACGGVEVCPGKGSRCDHGCPLNGAMWVDGTVYWNSLYQFLDAARRNIDLI